MDSGSGSRWPTGWLLSFHHIIQHIHVARLGSVPPRRASVFVCRNHFRHTKTQLAPVRRRVQFRHSQRTIPLSKKHLRNKKSRADSPLQYYEDLQGLKSVLVGHARPPKDIGNQPPKTALPCRQTTNKPSMKLVLYLFIDPAFQDFGNSYRRLFLHDEMLPFVRAGTLFLNSRTREFVRERTLERTC